MPHHHRRARRSLSLVCAAAIAVLATAVAAPVRAASDATTELRRASVGAVTPASATAGQVVAIAVPADVAQAPGLAVDVTGVPAAIVSRGVDRVEVRLPDALLAGDVAVGVRSLVHHRAETTMRVEPAGPVFDRAVTIDTDDAAAVISTVSPAASSTIGNGALALAVPTGAVGEPVDVRLAPLVELTGAPLTLVGGARFSPDGLHFTTPATLTLATDAGEAAPGLVGFVFDGDGTAFSIRAARPVAGGVAVRVDHFSGAGVGRVSEADFVRYVQPLVMGAFPLSLQLMDDVADLVVAWEEQFGPGFCERTSVCTQAVTQVARSAKKRIDMACEAGRQRASETLVREIVEYQTALQLLGAADPTYGTDCQIDMIRTMIAADGQRALDLPSDERIERVLDLAVLASLFGFDSLLAEAMTRAAAAVDRIVTAALPRCDRGDTEEAAAEAELRRAFDWHTKGLDTTRTADDVATLIEGCGLQIDITSKETLVAVAGTSVAVNAVITHSDSQRVAWAVSGDATISGGGLAGTLTVPASAGAGTRTVTATSVANPNRSATAVVEVVVDALRWEVACSASQFRGEIPLTLKRPRSTSTRVRSVGFVNEPSNTFLFESSPGVFKANRGSVDGFATHTFIPTATLHDGQVVKAPPARHVIIEDEFSNGTAEPDTDTHRFTVRGGDGRVMMTGSSIGARGATCTPRSVTG